MDTIIRSGYCVYAFSLCEGPVPVVSDGEGKYVVFETELAAQKEIADHMMTRLREFMDNERDFEDAITVEEYVVQVTIRPDGLITAANGNSFDQHLE